MADRNEIQTIVIEPMRRLYQPPRHWKPEDISLNIEDYFNDLSGFGVERLTQGWQAVRRKHRSQTWPMPGEIVDACDAVAIAKKPSARTEKPFISESEILARPGGQIALREGWALDLVEFVDRYGRYPNQDEARHLRGVPQRFRETLIELAQIPDGPTKTNLERLAAALAEREDKLKSKYLREDNFSGNLTSKIAISAPHGATDQ